MDVKPCPTLISQKDGVIRACLSVKSWSSRSGPGRRLACRLIGGLFRRLVSIRQEPVVFGPVAYEPCQRKHRDQHDEADNYDCLFPIRFG